MSLGALSQLGGKTTVQHAKIVETAELKVSVMNAKDLPGRGLPIGSLNLDNEDDREACLEREVSFMGCDDISKRRASLSRILQLAQSPQTHPVVLSQVWDAVSLELMKRMADPVERCRDMAMRAMLAFLDRVTAVAHMLPVAVPCLQYRMGTLPPEESSEEVRLLLILVLSRIITLLPKQIGQYMDAVDTIVRVGLEDVNPSVRKEACHILVLLTNVQKERMRQIVRYETTRAGEEPRYRYGELIKALKSTLKHKHSTVRVMGISALENLLLVGHKNVEIVEDIVAWQLPNIIPVWHFFNGGVWEDGELVKPEQRETQHNMLALLAGDTSAQVRAAFHKMLIEWMTRLYDRWDHENRLLPYLLNGLADSAPALRQSAFEAMERLGATHEDEKGNNDKDKQELIDFREYGHKTPAERNAAERWRTRTHEPPFTRRPRLGARMVVRNSFRRLTPTLLREINDWVSKTRASSAQLLYYLTLYTEYWATDQVTHMMTAYVKCVEFCLAESARGDPEARSLLQQVLLCAETLGEFTDPATYMPLLLPAARGELELDLARRCAHVEVLTAMVRGCSPSWMRPSLPTVVRALDCDAVWESRDPTLSSHLARCALEVARTCHGVLEEGERTQILRLLLPLQVKAWAHGARRLPPGGGEPPEAGWECLQATCCEGVAALADSAGEPDGAFMARRLGWALDELGPVCTARGAHHRLALLEVAPLSPPLCSRPLYTHHRGSPTPSPFRDSPARPPTAPTPALGAGRGAASGPRRGRAPRAPPGSTGGHSGVRRTGGGGCRARRRGAARRIGAGLPRARGPGRGGGRGRARRGAWVRARACAARARRGRGGAARGGRRGRGRGRGLGRRSG